MSTSPVAQAAADPGVAEDRQPSPARPLLTICTPTYERPDLLRRALGSVLAQATPDMTGVELLVSDNSTGDEPERIAGELLPSWPGPSRYVRNRPSVGMIENHNRCLSLAAGRYITFLHDDDLLVPGGIAAVLAVIDDPAAHAVNLFGVDVVRMDGSIRRRQRYRRRETLTPSRALHRLLTDSSFVRLPGVVASAEAYREAGPFDPDAGNAIDLDMWVRLFARHGLLLVPEPLAAYTVHEGALTSGMFTPETVDRLMRIFERASALGVLTPAELRGGQARWFHKFVLAGAYRCLESGDRGGAAHVLRLFEVPSIRGLGVPARWLPARTAFSLITLGAHRTDPSDTPIEGAG